MSRIPYFLVFLFLTEFAISQNLTVLDGNNVETIIGTNGTMWWDYNDAYYRVNGEKVDRLFSGGIWVGGIDEMNQLKVAAQTYRQSGDDFWPGPIENAQEDPQAAETEDWDRHWKINKSEILELNAKPKPIPLDEIPEAILTWPAKGNPFAMGYRDAPLEINKEIAPFIDMDSDGVYRADLGDIPDIPGDQALFWVFNDMYDKHTSSGGESLNIEIKAFAYACAGSAPIGETTFYRYILTHYGDTRLDSMHFANFTDVDLGSFDDDFVACDTIRNLGIGYNGKAFDGPAIADFGDRPPTIAVDILRGFGKSNLDRKTRRNMSYFMYYDGDFSVTGNPRTPLDHFRYMSGYWKNNAHWTYGGNGYGGAIETNYMFPSPPSEPLPAWSECSEGNTPFDRRFLMSSGPFSMEPGVSDTIDIAVVTADAIGPQMGCQADFSRLNSASDYVQSYYEAYILSGIYKNGLTANRWEPEIIEITSMSINPNPTRAGSLISWPQAIHSDKIQISIYNLDGKLMFRTPYLAENQFIIEAWFMSPGLYLVSLEDYGHRINSIKWTTY
ncbi:MAG: hypothetical protein ACI9P5_004724 [Saprospiraceae bacterium]|jgi:hypothetical protein